MSQALATLAAIVISGVVSLVDYSEAIYLWRVHKFDFFVWMIAFLGTLFLGVELGLGLAVGISLLLVIFESAYPHTAVLGRLPGTHHYRNVKQYPNAEKYDGIILIRLDAPFYFANTQHIREKIQKYYERAEEQLQVDHTSKHGMNNDSHEIQRVQFIVLELTPVSHIDTSALHALHEMKTTFEAENVQLCLANPNPRVMKRLVSSGFADEIGRDHIFVGLHDAVHYCLNHMDNLEIKHLSQMSLNKLNEQNASERGQNNNSDAAQESGANLPTGNSEGDLGLNV